MNLKRFENEIKLLLEKAPSLGKSYVRGSVMMSILKSDCSGYSNIKAIADTLNNGDAQDLSMEQTRQLIHYIDFLAVALPDNDTIPWEAELLKLASSMRQDFAKTYGCRTYDC